MHQPDYPASAPPELVGATVFVDEALHELSFYDDHRAVDTGSLAGSLELALWALHEELECWRQPPQLVVV